MCDIRVKLKCQKCGRLGSHQMCTIMMTDCQHFFCQECLCSSHTKYIQNRLAWNCSICSSYSHFVVLPDSLIGEPLCEVPQDDQYKCVECETAESEQNLQLCATCHELKFKDLEDVKKHTLCPACAIRKHMRKGHQTADFYPYSTAYNFSLHSSKIDAQSEELKSAQDLLNKTFSNFNNLSTNVSENYNVLTDMAKRSKSTKNQVKFFEKMEKFMNESKSIHVEADSDIKKHTTKLKATLAEIKEWYGGKMEDCVDDSEVVKLPNPGDADKEVDA